MKTLSWERDNIDNQCPGSQEVAIIPFILTTVEGKMINLQKGSGNKRSGGKPSLEEKGSNFSTVLGLQKKI